MKIEIRFGKELSKENKVQIEEHFLKKYSACSFEYIKDESIIGGFVAKCGDSVYDASVKNRLEFLAKELIY